MHKIFDLTENRTHELWVTAQACNSLRYYSFERIQVIFTYISCILHIYCYLSLIIYVKYQ